MPKVLVVDDDPSVRGVVSVVLELGGHEVVQAADGVSALHAVALERPDCVVLDVMMPGLDGHAVLQAVREADGPALPVIMLTAADDDAQAWRAWTLGVDCFLAKPFEPDVLLRHLDRLLRGPGAPASGAPVRC